jgi:WD repeat-containing protein 92
MNKLSVTTLESKIHIFDLRTLHPELGYAGLSEVAHNSTVWGAKFLPQNRDIFITQGGNGAMNLYKYNYPSSRSVKDDNGIEKGVIGNLTLLNGDWGLGIGDWAQSPIPNPQSPIPNPHLISLLH